MWRIMETSGQTSLYEVFLKLKSTEACEAFFKDLCTPAELKAMKERWLVAQLLHDGKLSYRQIHDETGVSIATITRVARFLFHENNAGYKSILPERKVQNTKKS
ncbi:MAG: YerC/YecD family TrpR-related protein [Candidatus Midichloria sp.]|nr:MAG: YerC/YecD family TrpR-related protein [Candidatus Midichloria sp.]